MSTINLTHNEKKCLKELLDYELRRSQHYCNWMGKSKMKLAEKGLVDNSGRITRLTDNGKKVAMEIGK